MYSTYATDGTHKHYKPEILNLLPILGCQIDKFIFLWYTIGHDYP